MKRELLEERDGAPISDFSEEILERLEAQGSLLAVLNKHSRSNFRLDRHEARFAEQKIQ